MALEPHLDFRDDDPAYRQTIVDAQETLPEFRALLRLPGEANALVCIKTMLTVGEAAANVWLLIIKPTKGGFFASVFEIPGDFPDVEVNDRFEVADDDVLDWMYNMDGLLHGGYSLRFQRSLLPPDQHPWFDERIGVREYV